MALSSGRLPHYESSLLEIIKANRTSLSILASLLSLPLVRLAYLDYRGWYDLGAGGVPHNIFGWALQSAMRIFATPDTKSTACYETAGNFSNIQRRSYFKMGAEIPHRKGIRPKTGVWVAPHRQLSMTSSKEMVTALEAELAGIYAANDSLLEKGPSKLEGGYSVALFVHPSLPLNHKTFPTAPREIFHIHESEGSSHAILSPVDAKTVLEKGWGERHGLSGRVGGVPSNYVMIYSPRDEEELDVVGRIARAAVGYGVEGREIH